MIVLDGVLRMRELAITCVCWRQVTSCLHIWSQTLLLSGLSCLSPSGKSSLTALSLAHSLHSLGALPCGWAWYSCRHREESSSCTLKVTQ